MTAQFSENIEVEGKPYSLHSTPLGPWLSEVKPPVRFVATSTACWRGYIGTWRIEQQRLYLVNLAGEVFTDEKASYADETFRTRTVTMDDLFPGWPDGVFAHWYSGELRIIRGNLVRYKHQGWMSRFEFEQYLTVEAGVVVGERFVHNTE